MGIKKKSEIVRNLGYFYPKLEGWQLTDYAFISPHGEVFDIQWMLGLHWYFQKLTIQRSDLRDQIRALEAENAELRRILPKMADVIKFPGKNNN